MFGMSAMLSHIIEVLIQWDLRICLITRINWNLCLYTETGFLSYIATVSFSEFILFRIG